MVRQKLKSQSLKQNLLMLRKSLLFVVLLALTLILCPFAQATSWAEVAEAVNAEAPTRYTVRDIQRVYDQANLMTEEEVASLEQQLTKLAAKHGEEVIFVSTESVLGKATRDFAADFYDEVFPEDDASGAIILLDMENRELNIVTSGHTMAVVTDDDEERLYDAGFDNLLDGDIYGMNRNIIYKMDQLLERGVVAGHTFRDEKDIEPEPNKLTIVDILGSLAGALGVGGSYVGVNRATYKPKTRKLGYNISSNSMAHFAQPIDKLINRTIRMIPMMQNRSSGDSYDSRTTTTTFKGSSGRTHGGGSGRKF